MTAVVGAYLSIWQGKVNLRGGHDYALDLPRLKVEHPEIGWLWIKATSGAYGVDPLYEVHRKMATDAGYPIGLFHYMNNVEDPDLQARHFWEVAGKSTDGLTILPAVDIEEPSRIPPNMGDFTARMLSQSDGLWGVKVMPYTRQTFWDPWVRSYKYHPDPRFFDRKWWIAHYMPAGKTPPTFAEPWLPIDCPEYAVWQWGVTLPDEMNQNGVIFTKEQLNPRLSLADISFPRTPPAVSAPPPADQIVANMEAMLHDFHQFNQVGPYLPLSPH